MANAIAPIMKYFLNNNELLIFLRMAFRAKKAWSKPPTPIAKAPIARGLTAGAKLAAVPVVPHNVDAKRIARQPL